MRGTTRPKRQLYQKAVDRRRSLQESIKVKPCSCVNYGLNHRLRAFYANAQAGCATKDKTQFSDLTRLNSSTRNALAFLSSAGSQLVLLSTLYFPPVTLKPTTREIAVGGVRTTPSTTPDYPQIRNNHKPRALKKNFLLSSTMAHGRPTRAAAERPLA